MRTAQTTKVRQAVATLNQAYKMGKRDSGEVYYYVDLPVDHALRRLLFEINGKALGSDYSQLDDWYALLGDVLDQLHSSKWKTEEEAHEIVRDQESDMYNGDLVAWLGRSLWNAEWVDEAMRELGATTVFDALSYGQQRQREEWASGIVDGLFHYAASEDRESSVGKGIAA